MSQPETYVGLDVSLEKRRCARRPRNRPAFELADAFLRNRGLPVFCVDARLAKAALKMQINKTDANDAWGLAQVVRTGWFREIAVKSMGASQLRTLLVAATGRRPASEHRQHHSRLAERVRYRSARLKNKRP